MSRATSRGARAPCGADTRIRRPAAPPVPPVADAPGVSTSTAPGVARSARTASGSPAVRRPARSPALDEDADPIRRELRRQALAGRGQGRGQWGDGHEVGEVVEEARLALTPLGRVRAIPHRGRQLRGDDRHDEERDQGHPLVGVAHGEREARLDEEEVEGEEGEDRCGDRRSTSRDDGDEQHGAEVDHRLVRDAERRDRGDDQRGHRDGAHGQPEAGGETRGKRGDHPQTLAPPRAPRRRAAARPAARAAGPPAVRRSSSSGRNARRGRVAARSRSSGRCGRRGRRGRDACRRCRRCTRPARRRAAAALRARDRPTSPRPRRRASTAGGMGEAHRPPPVRGSQLDRSPSSVTRCRRQERCTSASISIAEKGLSRAGEVSARMRSPVTTTIGMLARCGS